MNFRATQLKSPLIINYGKWNINLALYQITLIMSKGSGQSGIVNNMMAKRV